MPQLIAESPATRTKGHLHRILGVGFGVAVIVGNTVGSGILRTPGEIAGHLRTPALVMAVWIAGGLYAFFCTLAVTELGTMLPQAGGWYVYSRRAFGNYGGFVVGCSDWMVQASSMAFLAVAFGEFAAEFQPALHGRTQALAIGILILLALLNWLGLRTGARTQELTSLVKCVALVGFVVACFAIAPRAGAAAPAGEISHVPAGGLIMALLVSLQGVIITYDGWYGAIYFTEEDTNPAESLPRSSIAGVVACIAIYLLVNLALLHVLPMNRLAGATMPSADAALAIFGSRGKQVILIVSLVAALSTINAILLMSPRILFGMSRDGLLPRKVASVNAGGTPATALWLSTLAAGALVLFARTFDKIIAMSSFLFVAVYLSGFCALFVLRRREPDLPRPFKLWGYPWTNLGVLLASAAFLVATIVGDLKDALFTLVLIGLSYPIYRFVVARFWLQSAE
jgi:basic amino acid/polyamine antiporter, APA family